MVYDQLYGDHETTAEEVVVPTTDWVSYKDSFNPANLHWLGVVSWRMWAEFMSPRQARDTCVSRRSARGCGSGMFVIKIGLHVSTVVCRDISKFASALVVNVWGFNVENTWAGYTKAYLFVQGYHEQSHRSTYVPRPCKGAGPSTASMCSSARLLYALRPSPTLRTASR